MMRKFYKRLSLMSAAMLMLCSVALAQDRVVTGKVTDETGSGMPGVNIVLKGTSVGTATDSNGMFSISVPNEQAVIVVSFVGYASSEVTVGNRSNVEIQLTPDVTTLQELVVTGYTVEKKADIIGSVAVVDSKDLMSTPAANLTTQLQGRAAGVIVSSSGEPGAAARVRIRGFASFGTNDPLYVIDGVPTEDASKLNPQDVESLQVLKDATSASIYGSRAANGVIVITTKRGKAGTSRITYDGYYGVQSVPKSAFPEMLNTEQYVEYLKRTQLPTTNHPVFGLPASYTIPEFFIYGGPSGFKGGASAGDPLANPSLYSIDKKGAFNQILRTSEGTNWFDEVTRSAPMQSHQISASGGTDKGNYNVGLNYFNQDGVFPNTNFKRYLMRVNTMFNPQGFIRIGENLQFSYESRLGNDNKGEGGAWAQAYRMAPYIPVYDIGGGFGGNGVGSSGNGSNPIANLYRQRDNTNDVYKVFGNVFAELDIMKNLTFRTSFGIDYFSRTLREIVYQTYERSENINTTQLKDRATNGLDWTWTNTVKYEQTFGDHNLKVLLGTEAVKSRGRGFEINTQDFDIENPELIFIGTSHTVVSALNRENNSNGAPLYYRSTLASLFGRIDYQLKDKYLFNATVRRDGSSKFGTDNRYGVFPAFGLGWRISEESFMEGISFISDLKLRGGWGQMGSQKNVDPLNSYSTFITDPSVTNYDISGSNTSVAVGFGANRLGSSATKWETTTTTNIGFDASLLDGKVDVSFNWFSNVTTDLLIDRQRSSLEPAVTQPKINVGEMKNNGIDITIGTRGNVTGDLQYNATFTVTAYKNELTRFNSSGTGSFDVSLDRLSQGIRTTAGHPISSFYGYQIDGFWQSAAEIAAGPVMEGAVVGSWRYKDTNNDNKIDDKDKVFLGNPHPKLQLGANLGLVYKNFDFTAFFFWNYGNDIYNYTKYYTDMRVFVGGVSTRVLNEGWTPENPTGSLPYLAPGAANGYTSFTSTTSNSYYIESGSYLRLRNLQIGYSVPSTFTERARLQGLRVYVQGQNLFTVTNYSGPDPDLNIQSGNGQDQYLGVDRSGFPNTRQLIVGLNLSF
jgi:TonB-dependent starch-binding outer membrane protein SusC